VKIVVLHKEGEEGRRILMKGKWRSIARCLGMDRLRYSFFGSVIETVGKTL
jgi:hypothetical protein